MKPIVRFVAGALLAVGGMTVLAEAALRMLPVVQGLARQADPAPGASARLAPGSRIVFSMGWDLRAPVVRPVNAQGFVSPVDYVDGGESLAVLGDSFVEAMYATQEASISGQFERAMGGRVPAYSFGMSDAAMPHYLGLARETGRQYRIKAAMVVINENDYTEGFRSIDGLYRWADGAAGDDLVALTPAHARVRSGLTETLRTLALVRYFRMNLRVDLPTAIRSAAVAPACTPGSLTDVDRRRIDGWVEMLAPAMRLPAAKVVLVLNQDYRKIYRRVDTGRGDDGCVTLDALAMRHLAESAGRAGYRVLHADEVLEAFYRKTRRQLDHSPADHHWNGTTTRVIADEAAALLGKVSASDAAVPTPSVGLSAPASLPVRD